jgi:hypothetical protein
MFSPADRCRTWRTTLAARSAACSILSAAGSSGLGTAVAGAAAQALGDAARLARPAGRPGRSAAARSPCPERFWGPPSGSSGEAPLHGSRAVPCLRRVRTGQPPTARRLAGERRGPVGGQPEVGRVANVGLHHGGIDPRARATNRRSPFVASAITARQISSAPKLVTSLRIVDSSGTRSVSAIRQNLRSFSGDLTGQRFIAPARALRAPPPGMPRSTATLRAPPVTAASTLQTTRLQGKSSPPPRRERRVSGDHLRASD